MKKFEVGIWQNEINVRDFIQTNYTLYEGDSDFLKGPTSDTTKLWEECLNLTKQENENGGVLDMDTDIISTITSHGPGYLDKEIEKIVGLQTDKAFKRSLQPNGGIKTAANSLKAYGYNIDKNITEIFSKHRKTHNQGVFDCYTEEMRKARRSGIITGLPDAYGRGRIIGDYRRVALYGIDFLIIKKQEFSKTCPTIMSDSTIRKKEETSDQIVALNDIKIMAASYGFDISKPAKTAQEAIQWLYFGYLAAIKEQNGAAMSLGRTSTFIDIYIEKDIQNGILTEESAQELIDQFIMKLRLVKFARTPDYNELFSGDPTWVTESLAGVGLDGRPLVTKTSFRYLWTLSNIGTAPEPNMTVLWSPKLPQNFKDYCAKMSTKTSSIQYENDDLMRTNHGDDYAIACCVSPMAVGKEMQFFGARANLAKALLYSINGGIDEKSKVQISPEFARITDDVLNYDEVMKKFENTMEWLAKLYINTLNIIHYMHDKYCYEASGIALHDDEIKRFFATGIAGLSVATDSLSAIKYAKVSTIRDENDLVIDYKIEGDYPQYGNDDDKVDLIAVDLVKMFVSKLKKHKTYRHAETTMSILTITSNVVYGEKTGNTPDGRKDGEPFAPGANPMHGRDKNGALASLSSVSKIPFKYALDGISNTFSVVPDALGKETELMAENLSINAEDLGMNVEDVKKLVDECGPNSACSIPNIEVEKGDNNE